MKGKLSAVNLKNLCQYVINPLQLGGIETYLQANGPGCANPDSKIVLCSYQALSLGKGKLPSALLVG